MPIHLTETQDGVLRSLARTYIWWKSPNDALRFPETIIAQVMNRGDWNDVRLLETTVGEQALRSTIQHAVIGQFNARSWHFWHYRLGLTKPSDSVPPLPQRRVS